MKPTPPKSSSEARASQLAASPQFLALLKILEMGTQDVAAGRTKPAADVVARLRGRVRMPAGSDTLREKVLAGAASVPAAAADASYFEGLRARLKPSE